MSRYIIIEEEFQNEVFKRLDQLDKRISEALSKIIRKEDLMDSADIQEYLKINRKTLYNYINNNERPLPAEKINGKLYFWKPAIDKYLNKPE